MNEQKEKNEVILFLGCPEVPVQMGISLYLSYILVKKGYSVTVAANPSVIKLARVSDPERHYMGRMIDLDHCIGDLAEKKISFDTAIAFAHNDAGITYATTIRYLHASRLILVIIGRNAEDLKKLVDFQCEMVVEKTVHNPVELKKKLDEVFL